MLLESPYLNLYKNKLFLERNCKDSILDGIKISKNGVFQEPVDYVIGEGKN